MPDPDKGQGSGPGNGQAGQGDGAAGAAGADAGGGDPGGKTPDKDAPITAAIVGNILDTNIRNLKREFGETITELKGLVTKQGEAITALLDGKSSGAAHSDDDDSTKGDRKKGKAGSDKTTDGRVLELQRQVEELTQNLTTEREQREKAVKDGREKQFERDVVDSLTRAGCKRPKTAFRAIAPDLTHADDGRIFIEYEDPDLKQKLTLELDDYVVGVVREKLMPELFDAKSSPGAAVGGAGAGEGSPQYEIPYAGEKGWSNPVYYKENIDKIREAARRGKVEPAPGWDSFHA